MLYELNNKRIPKVFIGDRLHYLSLDELFYKNIEKQYGINSLAVKDFFENVKEYKTKSKELLDLKEKLEKAKQDVVTGRGDLFIYLCDMVGKGGFKLILAYDLYLDTVATFSPLMIDTSKAYLPLLKNLYDGSRIANAPRMCIGISSNMEGRLIHEKNKTLKVYTDGEVALEINIDKGITSYNEPMLKKYLEGQASSVKKTLIRDINVLIQSYTFYSDLIRPFILNDCQMVNMV